MKKIVSLFLTFFATQTVFAANLNGSFCVNPSDISFEESTGSIGVLVKGSTIYYLDRAYHSDTRAEIRAFFEGIATSATLGHRHLLVNPLELNDLGAKGVELDLHGGNKNALTFGKLVRIDFKSECK